MRIGEAKNPGPRKKATFREGDLDSRLLQSSITLFYEDRLWEAFLTWCSRCLSDPFLVFSLCPALAAMALRAYGNFSYSTGKLYTIIAA